MFGLTVSVSRFATKREVKVEKPRVPVIQTMPAYASQAGGVQGLGWYAKQLAQDEDGDVACEFLEEVQHDESNSTDNNSSGSGSGSSSSEGLVSSGHLRKTFKPRYLTPQERVNVDPTRFSLEQGNVYLK